MRDNDIEVVYINSYYSEADWRDVNYNCADGFYEVHCKDVEQFKKDVKKTYDDFQDNDETVTSLEMVLEYLQETDNIISWEKHDCIKFDCDYGSFED